MELKEVMQALEQMGDAQTKKTLSKHGAKEPFYGVKVAGLKTLVKKIKKDHKLALDLYATGNSDAMYLAALIADETSITKKELDLWAKNAYWYYLSEYSVPWIAADSPYGMDRGLKWKDNKKENISSCGWATLSSVASVVSNENLDKAIYSDLLDLIPAQINGAANRVRYTMNGFVIATGSYIPDLTSKAKKIAKKIGKVHVEMGGTACKVPLAKDYIEKIEKAGRIGNKRKMARC